MARILPVLLLKDVVILPNQVLKIESSHPLSLETILTSEKEYNNELIIISPKDSLEEKPEIEDLPNMSVIARIEKDITLPNGQVRVTFKGIRRVKIQKYFNSTDNKNILKCSFFHMQIPRISEGEADSLQKELKKIVKRYIKNSPTLSNEILHNLEDDISLNDLTDYVAGFIPLTLEKKMFYLEQISPLRRANKLIEDLITELKVLKLDQKINASLQQGLEDNQKEFVLRERMKEIQRELGEEDKKTKEIEKYLEKLNSFTLPNSTRTKVLYEIRKYEFMNEMSPEITFVRNYLELFFSLPWNEETIEVEDLKLIEKSLNKTHYGLKQVKTRVLEYAAMKKRNPLLQAPIICLVGPPGVGKSTIALSIANALHRKFYKINVGGLNDSSELTGHRRTYLGSAPGRVITALQKCGTKNPLILIDEVDKMVKDYKGDPASVLLDILDPNLNQSFVDSYLEEPMDLSHVLFFLTANYIENIPSELKDRLEIIPIQSYSTLEKMTLARDYLLPLVYLDYHIREKEVVLTDNALKYLIIHYTNEAGVRDLKRKLEELYRKVILNSTKNEKNLAVTLETKDVKKYLVERTELEDLSQEVVSPGLVSGLAVGDYGGIVLPFESVVYSGTGNVIVTGLIGDVMSESLEVVLSHIKSHLKEYDMNEKMFKNKDIHIHVLEGSIKKDGPSAGVTLATSLISLLTNRVVDKTFAMTGEMTLRGEIIPVGNIKEKLIGAFNRGIKSVIIPEKNKLDLKTIPKEVKEKLEIILVKEYSEIYQIIFKKSKKIK